MSSGGASMIRSTKAAPEPIWWFSFKPLASSDRPRNFTCNHRLTREMPASNLSLMPLKCRYRGR
jgi:hypothetical protein